MATEPERGEVLLSAHELTVRYGGVTANDAISIEIRGAEVVGLIGPNGAGKTTFIDAVSGFTKSKGEVRLEGRRIDSLAPHRRRRLGLARTWQAGELFADLTAAQNLEVACRGTVGLRTILGDLVGRGRHGGAVEGALEAVGLSGYGERWPEDLSLGEQKLVGVARALAGESRVLLLDEPAAGLDSNESLRLGMQLRKIAAGGIGILLVDHDMDLVMEICDRIYVLNFGHLICEGSKTEVIADEDVAAAYLGSPEPELHEAGS
ncbi:MAG TPA: ATP-binding cassette domain-containing protein [Solirubrobacterales bacterium]|nr:ATP-binding cassette domain-containing protein [Solirubrobacterales bacterium]